MTRASERGPAAGVSVDADFLTGLLLIAPGDGGDGLFFIRPIRRVLRAAILITVLLSVRTVREALGRLARRAAQEPDR